MFSQCKLSLERWGSKHLILSFLFLTSSVLPDTVEKWNPTQGFHKEEMNLLHKAKVNFVKIIDKTDNE